MQRRILLLSLFAAAPLTVASAQEPTPATPAAPAKPVAAPPPPPPVILRAAQAGTARPVRIEGEAGVVVPHSRFVENIEELKALVYAELPAVMTTYPTSSVAVELDQESHSELAQALRDRAEALRALRDADRRIQALAGGGSSAPEVRVRTVTRDSDGEITGTRVQVHEWIHSPEGPRFQVDRVIRNEGAATPRIVRFAPADGVEIQAEGEPARKFTFSASSTATAPMPQTPETPQTPRATRGIAVAPAQPSPQFPAQVSAQPSTQPSAVAPAPAAAEAMILDELREMSRELARLRADLAELRTRVERR